MQLKTNILTNTPSLGFQEGLGNAYTKNDVAILALSGRFDAHLAPNVKEWLTSIQTVSQPKVVINLKDVHFIDSAALAVLVSSMKNCRQRNGNLVLCELKQSVRIIFELTHLDSAFMIYENETMAVQALTI